MSSIGIYEIIMLLACISIPLIIAVIAVAAFFVYRQTRAPESQRVKCPYCAELIMPEAKVCRYCGREITPDE